MLEEMGLMFDVSTPVTCAESPAVPARLSLGDQILKTLGSNGDSDEVKAGTLALTKTVPSKEKVPWWSWWSEDSQSSHTKFAVGERYFSCCGKRGV